MSEIALRALRQPPRHRADAVTDTTLWGAVKFDFHTGSGKRATSEGRALSSFRSGLICQPRRSSIRLLFATSARRTVLLGARKSSTAGRECGRSWMKPSSPRHPQKRKARRPTNGRALRSCTHISLRAARGRRTSVPTRRVRSIVGKDRYPCLDQPAW